MPFGLHRAVYTLHMGLALYSWTSRPYRLAIAQAYADQLPLSRYIGSDITERISSIL